MPETQKKKTVPFPSSKPQKEETKAPVVSLWHPLIEKVAVPAAWFAGGILFAKIFLRKKAMPPMHGGMF